MRITIAAIGRMKAGAERDLADTYIARARALGRQAGITGLEVREGPESTAASAELRRAEETQRLLQGLDPQAYVIALDERGTAITSPAFATRLGGLATDGKGELAFLIGGPDGLDRALVAGAGLVLAFGPMTWPHRLARAMLAEQIYRAVTILVNHPYHRA
jgi:23S rRNA (pseudouridine1915-N3)-methyltransferase